MKSKWMWLAGGVIIGAYVVPKLPFKFPGL